MTNLDWAHVLSCTFDRCFLASEEEGFPSDFDARVSRADREWESFRTMIPLCGDIDPVYDL